MTKHKLDGEVEDILQHYGIKGMKWDVIRSDAQIVAATNDESAGGGEQDESLLNKIGDTIDETMSDIKTKMSDISDSLKKKGMSVLVGIFGKSEVKYTPAKSNEKRTQALRDVFKKIEKKNRTKHESYAIDKYKKDNKTRGDKAANSSKSVDDVLKKYKEKGYKAQPKLTEKEKKAIAKKYKFRVETWDGK